MKINIISKPRKRAFRRPSKVLYLICEGKKTEPVYFKSIHRKYRDYLRDKYSIQVVQNKYTDPVGLVKIALEKSKYLNDDDEVWCVFDVNDHTNDELINAQNKAGSKIKIALSNPSFELWFLLHYEYSTRFENKDKVTKRLKKYINNYEKNVDTFKVLAINPNSLLDAISRAKQLNKHHKSSKTPIFSTQSNPSTQVFRIFELLKITKY